MEPMALGSPSSPQSSSAFLPAYLIGEPMTPPRNTTISPTKGGRALAFGQSPSSPKDPLNRSSAFHNRNPLSPSSGNIFMANHQGPGQNLNASVSGGPPTQGLFDTLSTERNFIQDTSSPRINSTTTATGLPLHQQQFRQISSPFTPQQQPTSTMNDSLFNVTTPRRQSIIPGPKHNFTSSPFPAAPQTNANNQTTTTIQNPADCWVTVFGFPQSATSMILSHFSQCGTIINKLHPQNTGNWMHLKFTSRLECDRALNYNEKVLNNFFMIGVTRCKDPAVLELDQREDVENNSFAGNSMSSTVTNRGNLNNTSISGNNSSIRPLAYVAYKTVQSPADVVSPTAPTKSSGILDRAMDFFLSW